MDSIRPRGVGQGRARDMGYTQGTPIHIERSEHMFNVEELKRHNNNTLSMLRYVLGNDLKRYTMFNDTNMIEFISNDIMIIDEILKLRGISNDWQTHITMIIWI